MTTEEAMKRMKDGRIYCCSDEEISRIQLQCLDLQQEYNSTRPSDMERRKSLLERMFASFGENSYIEIPLHANWGGRNVHIGRNVYANFNLTLVDDADIYIDDSVMIGPSVVIATAAHPISPPMRKRLAQYNLPVHICRNAWLGAGVMVMPGVTIGENSVIGAGSVVTKDIPANVVAYGSPCKVVRPITEADLKYYRGNVEFDI